MNVEHNNRDFFFFSSRRRHTRWNCDWSSDVCSSDLCRPPPDAAEASNSASSWSRSCGCWSRKTADSAQVGASRYSTSRTTCRPPRTPMRYNSQSSSTGPRVDPPTTRAEHWKGQVIRLDEQALAAVPPRDVQRFPDAEPTSRSPTTSTRTPPRTLAGFGRVVKAFRTGRSPHLSCRCRGRKCLLRFDERDRTLRREHRQPSRSAVPPVRKHGVHDHFTPDGSGAAVPALLTVEPDDLDRAVTAWESAVIATGDAMVDPSERADVLSHASGAVLHRYQATRARREDLGVAQGWLEEAIAITPEDAPERLMYLSNAGVICQERYTAGEGRAMLDRAVDSFES